MADKHFRWVEIEDLALVDHCVKLLSTILSDHNEYRFKQVLKIQLSHLFIHRVLCTKERVIYLWCFSWLLYVLVSKNCVTISFIQTLLLKVLCAISSIFPICQTPYTASLFASKDFIIFLIEILFCIQTTNKNETHDQSRRFTHWVTKYAPVTMIIFTLNLALRVCVFK